MELKAGQGAIFGCGVDSREVAVERASAVSLDLDGKVVICVATI